MMPDNGYDPTNFADQLSKKLASTSRHLCVFLGSGASISCELPGMEGLEEEVAASLEGDYADKFDELLEDRDIEGVLDRLRKIASLNESDQQVDGLTEEDATKLDEKICKAITSALTLDRANFEPMTNFARWAYRIEYNRPLEVFTVNYDLLIESAFERQGLPYFDGFVGNLHGRFKPDLVERTDENREDKFPPEFVRLWKVHGSINWSSHDKEVVRLGRPVSSKNAAVIYPSQVKYEKSRRMPYLVLQDRLRRALFEKETLLIIAGYAFGDEHINEMIFEAVARRPRTEIMVFCYSDIPEVLSQRASRFSNLVVLSPSEAYWTDGVMEWNEPEEPNELIWNEEDGEFNLTDFANLARFLAQSEYTRDSELPDFLIDTEEIDTVSLLE